jgi:hypothetical protein
MSRPSCFVNIGIDSLNGDLDAIFGSDTLTDGSCFLFHYPVEDRTSIPSVQANSEMGTELTDRSLRTGENQPVMKI